MEKLVALALLATVVAVTADDAPCLKQGIARYNVTFEAFWSKRNFPKQYPTFRPHAQWTKVVGRTHGPHYRLWEEQARASAALKEFVELGTSERLDQEAQGFVNLLDVFNTRKLDLGVGTTSVKVLADPYHSKLSMAAHLIPSPDWFVGADSLELCEDGAWLESFVHDLPLLDAGTDRGFTFTAPNWPETPPKPITRISAKFPNHPANSFFYPRREKHPTLARLTLKKVPTMEEDHDVNFINTVVNDDSSSSPYRAPEAGAANLDDVPSVDDDKYELPFDKKPKRRPTFSIFKKGASASRPKGGKGNRKRPNKKNNRQPSQPAQPEETDSDEVQRCEVSEWQDWSECSKSCGYGMRVRTRHVISPAQNGGPECPALQEQEMCGSMRSCNWNHFSSMNKKARSRPTRRRGRGGQRDRARRV